MTSIQFFSTENINLTTYLVFLGYNLNIIPPTSGIRAIFEFAVSPDLLAAVIGYECNDHRAKALLDIRGRLYRESSAVVRQGVKR